MQTNRASSKNSKLCGFTQPLSSCTSSKSNHILLLLLSTLFLSNLPTTKSQYYSTPSTITQLNENDLASGFFQEERTFAFYSVTVSQTYFDTTQYLAFKVMTTSYQSDPDIFIAKNNVFPVYPTSANVSDQYCGKIGTDTCVISPAKINYLDTFYFGIRCIERCNYDLRIQYLKPILLSDSTQYNYISDGHSSILFSYYIPASASSGFTSAIKIWGYGSNTYNPINFYLSTDTDFYQVEEKGNQVVYSKGIALKFTSNDYNFKTMQYVYFLVDLLNQDSYYFTVKASARNEILTSGYSSDIVINSRQYECFQYSIQKTTTDVLFYATTYEGNAEVYISYQNYPQTIKDRTVSFISTIYPKRTILVTAKDRQQWNFLSGIYYICMNSYSDTSMSVTVYEVSPTPSYALYENNEFNARLQNNSNYQFYYTHSELNKPTTIQVTLIATPYLNPQTPPKIFYKVCPTSSGCSMTADEAQGKVNQTAREIGVVIQSNNTKVAFLAHDPSVCSNPSKCYYLFSVAVNTSSAPIQFAIIANHTNYVPSSAYINSAYVNVIDQSSYFYYQILPSDNSNMAFLSSLKINLITYQGDADLYVSTSNKFPSKGSFEYMSNLIGMYDQVIINTTSSIPVLTIPIYIGVYSYRRASFQINFSPYYIDQYNSQLQSAVPVYESKGFYTFLTNQYASAFYSFTPWWSGSERRDIVIYTQMVFNDLQLYASADALPVTTQSQYIGKNNTIYIPSNPAISAKTSTLFVKVVPNFALYDIISNRQFICYFFAFSQRTQGSMSDIYLNQVNMAFANNSHNYYRHFIESPFDTYVFTLNVASGTPTLLLGMSGGLPLYPTNGNFTSYMFIQQMKLVDGKNITQQKLSVADRLSVDPSCQNGQTNQPGYYLNGGNPACTFYIGVYCPYACVYNLTATIDGFNPNYTLYPGYLIENVYATGLLAANKTVFYYFPVTNNTGEVTFFLNKTKMQGYENGDMSLSMYVLNDTATQFLSFSINQWYWYLQSGYSASGYTNQPEIIEICSNTFNKFCLGNQSCAVLLGIHSKNDTVPSFYRLKAITDQKKLLNMQPILQTIGNVGDYHYYYFTNNITVDNPQAFWEFEVSLGIMTVGGDADLFISAVDGRNPSYLDYDFASQNNGGDSIYISSSTNFFTKSNYNVRNGILFVVGVRAMTQNVQYSLLLQGPTRYNYNITDIASLTPQTYTFLQARKTPVRAAGPQSITYRWFNFGSDKFQVSITASVGQVYAFLNFYSQESYLTNIYESIPVNENNSLWSTFVNTSQQVQLQVSKTEPIGLFCYFCWYYITVSTNYTAIDSTFSLSVSRVADSGAAIPLISTNTQTEFTIKSAQSLQQYKIMFDNKSPFNIPLTVKSGSVNMYIGLYPDAPTTQTAWTLSSQVGSATLSVRQTNPNFHIGSWYFITFVAQTGNTNVVFQVNQYKSVIILQSGVSVKDQFQTEEEQVKFYVIQAPLGTNKINISIQGIEPNFYPLVYLNKVNLSAAPSDYRTLGFANLTSYWLKFGDNITSVMNTNSVRLFTLSLSFFQFLYSYTDTANSNFSYQLITLYANSFGETDKRKAAFEIGVSISSTTLKQSPTFNFQEKKYEEIEQNKDEGELIGEEDFEYDDEIEYEKQSTSLSVKGALKWVKDKIASQFKFQKNDY